ncbi:MAG: FKBP-type peptidyl-prolyl cis-trans isomerase [Bacteroidaceae bacterium]|nr:FKBP-type peptidyl-prolyl cis-trans isomerase [Bacteroidaceae bacterium]
MKRFPVISVLLACTFLSLTSCGETKEFDDHANWKKRNTAFIDSIAGVCASNSQAYSSYDDIPVGKMFRILSFKLDSEKQWGNSSYIYCVILSKGDGTAESPQYSDSVRINYRVRLIPTDYYPEGQVIDQSYKTDKLDPELNIPSSFVLSSLIDGVSTAIMHMRPGDFWRVYIPYGLGYGTSTKSSIPGYSALIYEINLTESARAGKSLSPR